MILRQHCPHFLGKDGNSFVNSLFWLQADLLLTKKDLRALQDPMTRTRSWIIRSNVETCPNCTYPKSRLFDNTLEKQKYLKIWKVVIKAHRIKRYNFVLNLYQIYKVILQLKCNKNNCLLIKNKYSNIKAKCTKKFEI